MASDIPINDTRIKSMFNSFSDLIQGNRHNHKAVRLIDELMVDIMGGLIPGVLFNFSLIVCIVLPIVIYKYSDPHGYMVVKDAFNNHILATGSGTPAFGGWFWFAAFLTFLILSYIAGHIFYRSDINIADEHDIKKRIKNNKAEIKKAITHRIRTDKTDVYTIILELLKNELESLNKDLNREDLNLDRDSNTEDLKSLLAAIGENVGIIKNYTPYDEEVIIKSLFILFPHKYNNPNTNSLEWGFFENSLDNTLKNCLTVEEKQIFDKSYKEAESIISCLDLKWDLTDSLPSDASKIKGLTNLLTCYMILLLQNDSGCSYFRFQKDFPYLNFYKYLLKRNELILLQYVDWSQAGARTKNKINRMKMDIQLDYPDAYAILNKNESHIRMASSSWYVSRFIFKMAIIVCVSIFIIRAIQFLFPLRLGNINDILSTITDHWHQTPLKFIEVLFAILPSALPPLLLAILIYNMRNQLTKFIHYQRLREIYFTLYIYHKLEQRKQEAEDKGLRFEDALVCSFSRILNDCADRILLSNNDDGH